MSYKLFVSKANTTELCLDPRVIDIVTVDSEYNEYIIDADCKIPLLINTAHRYLPEGMRSYPIVINDVRESLISMSIRLKSLNIRHPKSFMITNSSLTKVSHFLDTDKKYILKADLQARGMYKLIVDKKVLNEYTDFLSTHVDIKLDKESLKEIFDLNEKEDDTLVSSNNKLNDNDSLKTYDEKAAYYIDHVLNNSLGEVRSKEEIQKQIRYYFCNYNDTMFVQELIDIKNEYRVVWFNTGLAGECVILKRSGFDIRNKEVRYDITTEVLSHLDKCDIMSTPVSVNVINSETVFDIIEKLGKSLNTFRLSIDLYEDLEGNFGIIEYQTELYTHDVPNIVNLTTRAMVYTIDNLK